MSNVFAKASAQAKQAAPSKGNNKATIVVPDDPQVRKAIDDFVEAKERIKNGDSEKQVAQAIALPFARTKFLSEFAENSKAPDQVILKGDKHTVKLVAQDRCGKTKVSDEQLETIKALLGDKRAEGLVTEVTDYVFDNNILNQPGVMDALNVAFGDLVSKNLLTVDQKDNLIKADAKRVMREGILDDLAKLCGDVNGTPDCDLMEQLCDAVGSNITIYIM